MNSSLSLILASKSPRRQQLLRDAGFEFEVIVKDTDESFPSDLPTAQVAAYIAQKKVVPFKDLAKNTVIITADTVVINENQILGKPKDEEEAATMLQNLSNKSHKVTTGVCLTSSVNQITFSDTTVVHFKELSTAEIDHYIDNYQPFDKAGAYGIQEWIGMIGVKKIEGSYFNVMGLPVHKIYKELKKF